MIQKRYWKRTAPLLACLCLGLWACTDDEAPAAPQQNARPVLETVTLQSAALEMTPAQSADSRALIPMNPIDENPMKSIAVIQFDEEGNMLEINPESAHPYYHYRTLVDKDAPSGVTQHTLQCALYTDATRNTRVCALANIPTEVLDTLLFNEAGNRYYLWNEFENRTISIPYKLPQGEGGTLTENLKDSIGHVKQVYMSGLFHDKLTPTGGNGQASARITIPMARLISRIQIRFKMGPDVQIPEGYRIFFAFYGVEKNAYVLSEGTKDKVDPAQVKHDHVDILPVDRTEEIKEKHASYYFYVAPHLVLDRNNATWFVLWCVPEGTTPKMLDDDFRENALTPENRKFKNIAHFIISNDPKEETPDIMGAYWINRNSVYHMNVTLTHTDASTRQETAARKENGTWMAPIINRPSQPAR